jgi:hypothetical protein
MPCGLFVPDAERLIRKLGLAAPDLPPRKRQQAQAQRLAEEEHRQETKDRAIPPW